MPDAAALATDFALMANERVRQMAPGLPLAAAGEEPLNMGWGVVLGEAAVGSIGGANLTVLGDAVNVAFRLAGLAGRAGRPPVLVTRGVKEMTRGGSIGGGTLAQLYAGTSLPTRPLTHGTRSSPRSRLSRAGSPMTIPSRTLSLAVWRRWRSVPRSLTG